MSLSKIIKQSKADKIEMSAISFNIPLVLKQQLITIAKENNITMNAFLVAMVDDVLNGELKEQDNLKVVEKLEELLNKEQVLADKLNKVDTTILDECKEALNINLDTLSEEDINQLNRDTGKLHIEQTVLQEELKDIRYMIKLLTRF